MSSKERYRHEWKYLIDMAQKELICQRLSPFLELDKHARGGGYMIRSLYFDDYFHTAYEEKDAGVLERKKYRIRVYNCSDSSIKLERKKKFGSYIFKEAARHAILDLAEAETALGIGEETALLGTRDGHVEQATLLFHLAGAVIGHHRGEELLFHADDEDGVELEALGGVHGHEPQRLMS